MKHFEQENVHTFFLRIQSEFRIFIKILTALKNGFGYLLNLIRFILYYEILES